jgi:putative spermidine/putrescine transport system ATP-binding protein
VNNAVSMTGFLELDSLEKRFGELPVTRGVSLSAEKGEIVALLGPSGSGKTTILRLTAGFETPDSGRILVEGEDVTRLAPERRRFGMVFQHYALFPHMTAGENVAFGLASQGAPRDAIEKRVTEMLAATGLSGLEKRKVTQLSGGQQQRVALARALAPSPRVLLLDEPLSNLDPSLREKTRGELKRFIRRIGITTLFVTHEQEEAFALGDRVALLNAGLLEQVGTPDDLYERPASRFVATFIGRSSVLPAVWSNPEARIRNGPAWTAVEGTASVPDGAEVDLVVRPEGLAFAGSSAAGALEGTIAERRYAGLEAYYFVATAAGEVEVLAPSAVHREGDRVSVVPSAGGPPPRVFPKPA